jgi:hypothetical protein
MARVHILKIGPIEGGKLIYVPMPHDAPTKLHSVAALDDNAGLAAIVDQQPTEELVCSPDLASAAAARGLAVETPPMDFLGALIQIALVHAQDGELDDLGRWGHLVAMMGLQEFDHSDIAQRWPAGRAFDVELSGDRTQRWAGWITPGVEPSVTLVRSRADADVLATASSEEREAKVASLDHLAVRLVVPPSYATDLIRDFYDVEAMPVFDIVENGRRRRATDEDAFVLAGVLGALGALEDIDGIGSAETESPKRKVTTRVGTSLGVH